MSASPARLAAVKALERCRRSGAWSSAVAASTGAGLEPRDAALCARIFLGVLQNMALCDFYIDSFSSVKTGKLEPKVLDILRASVYQLMFLERVPASAAVSEGVELCKTLGYSRAAGLVNAVLRRVSENRCSPPEPKGKGTARYLSVKYSHPLWLAEYMVAERGYSFAEGFFAANNTECPVTAQVNTLKAQGPDIPGAEPHPWLDNALELRGDPAALPQFRDGLIYVQDAAARLSVLAACLRPGERLLDCCAAPGGKSFAAAMDMRGEGEIVSCDIHEKKLKLIEDGAKRLGVGVISTSRMDAGEPRPEYLSAFDTVLCDAPCSGLGVIRKKPEIRFKDAAALSGLPAAQLRILRGAAQCVKPGGTLIYSTCTVIKRENEGVVAEFLASSPDFSAEAFALPGPAGEAETGMLTLWPHIHGTDGFFICRLRRKKT